MIAGCARTLVRLVAWIAPQTIRARWREEWLAEIDAMASHSRSPSQLLRRVAGAPWDAARARATAIGAARCKLVHGWRTDLRQTLRSLTHNPRHAITVVLCLATGLTVTVSVFSLVNALFYGDLPGVRERASLVRIFVRFQDAPGRPGGSTDALSIADFDTLADAPGPALTGVAAEGEVRVAASLGDVTTATVAAFTSPDYFAVLGTTPVAGRLLTAADHGPDAPPSAVLSYHLWMDRFGASPDLVGQRVIVADREFVVVGIAPPRFAGGRASDRSAELWLPLRYARGWGVAPGVDRPWLAVFGRRQPSSSVEDVQRSLAVASARRAAERPDTRARTAYVAKAHNPAPNADALELLTGLAMMFAIPLTVLAVACLNVANLQLARATTRSRELAVRLAIGASRLQIIRLLTFEAGLLACAAALVGCGGTAIGLQLAQSWIPLVVRLDVRVLLFVLVLIVAVTMVSGVLPAWVATRRSSVSGLKHSAQGGGLPHARLRHALVVLQIAASFVMLAGSSLFVRALQTARDDMPAVFGEQIVVAFDLKMLGRGDADAARVRREVEARLAARGDVRAVSFEHDLHAGYSATAAASAADWHGVVIKDVTPAYAAVWDLRLLSGRWLQTTDASHAVVVNDRLARQLATDGPVVGRRLFVPGRRATECDQPPCGGPEAIEIIGIVDNQKPNAFETLPNRMMYRLLDAGGATAFDMRVRTAAPDAVAGDLRAIVRSIDPALPWAGFWFGKDLYAGGDFDLLRLTALGVAGVGMVSLMLAAAGLYAVMAYVVSLRQREFGIRMAIGARPADLTRIVAGVAVRLAAAGLVVGVLLAVPLSFASRAFLSSVSLRLLDPWPWVPVITMLAVVAVTAAIVPARRAARVDPIGVLRAD